MTIAGVIALVDDIKPNAFSAEAKIAWLSECDGMVQTEIWLVAIENVITYTAETGQDTVLLAAPPHDKIYQAYLSAMIDFANGEYDRYQNTMQIFNQWFREYQRWYAQRYRPADQRAEPWKGYYYTAYGIAVKHGYEGTEEQWLASLQGGAGPRGEPGMAPPLVLDAGDAESYLTDPAYGDEALEAIIRNRQILVRTPNADGGKFTAIYSPILTYQLPNYENKYLYLFYLRDEKQDLSGILGADIKVPVYGELKMLLSETYNESPLVNPQEHLSDTLVYLKGKDGITPRITTVTAETLKPGVEATAEISGEPEELALKLGIPQGEPGKSPTINTSIVRDPDGRIGTRLEISNPDGTRHVATVYDGQTPAIEAERFEAANYWEMSSQDANGNAVYLYPGNSGYAGYPNRAAEYSRLNLTAGSEENTFSIVANDADVSNMDSCYLYFDRSNLRWDRVSSPGSNATWKTNTSLRLYRAAVEGEDSSTEIPGYVRITSLDYVVEGRYLIAAPGNDGGIYLLYPSTATANRYQQTAKVIDGNTAGIGSDSSFSAGTVALTDCLYTFAKDAETWESGVHLTVTNPGTDDRPDETTVVSILDGKEGPRGPQGENGEPGTAGSPRNWLDNSYFYKPVYQSGESSYSGAGPAIDRWTGLDGASMKLSSGGIYEWMGTYTQRVEWDPVLTAGPVTIAVKFSSGDVVSATGTLSDNSPVTAYFGRSMAELRMNSTKIEFLLYSPGGNPPVWAALYLGEFTLENLPEYQYKGYAAELMECRRYGLGPDAVSVDVEMLPAGEAATTSVSGTVERMNIALGIPSSAPKPLFVISATAEVAGNEFRTHYAHQFGDHALVTVEEMVAAYYGGCDIYTVTEDSGIYYYTNRRTGSFGISAISGVEYVTYNTAFLAGTKDDYTEAVKKYLPEELFDED